MQVDMTPLILIFFSLASSIGTPGITVDLIDNPRRLQPSSIQGTPNDDGGVTIVSSPAETVSDDPGDTPVPTADPALQYTIQPPSAGVEIGSLNPPIYECEVDHCPTTTTERPQR
jgi:hypothetical protein